MIRTPFGDQQVKLPAGHAVVYPSASVHRVAEVSRGERLVALTWIQSFVRDAARRELLYELDQSRQHLLPQRSGVGCDQNIDRSYVESLCGCGRTFDVKRAKRAASPSPVRERERRPTGVSPDGVDFTKRGRSLPKGLPENPSPMARGFSRFPAR